ncbi:2OG-Fe(II) oxygenase [Daejeonella sp.]|uniref:2OG-Fe(II) oxygenase n=1 Tax=Daejeonella sp. TaxID=2805397 RepID=UPI0030BB3DCA
MNLNQQALSAHWNSVQDEMNVKGYSLLPKFISPEQCDDLVANYENPEIYRKTVVMERYRFGRGEYKYFEYPLPPLIQALRETIYTKLAPVANLWMKVLNIERTFPEDLKDLQTECKNNGQNKPTPLILKYGKGGFNTMHQDLYGDVFFPIQCVLFLTEPDKDFTGGEFVLMQQIPRAQSKAIVLKPKKGDMLIFTTNFRPEKGLRGYYRINMKHGVSEVASGQRYTLGIIFHDALS